MKIYENGAFVSLIAWAKAILIENEKNEINSNVILNAALLSAEVTQTLSPSTIQLVKLITKNQKLIIPEFCVKTDKTFPISIELKSKLKNCNDDFENLIQLIIQDSRNNKNNEDTLHILLSYASEISRRLGKSTISTKIFTVASYYAFINGEFSNSKFLADYVLQYCDELKAIASFYQLPNSIALKDNQRMLELSDKLNKFLSSIDDNFTLVGVLNQGLDFGKSIIEELWVAYHEAGHAITIQVLADKSYGLESISIISKKGEYNGVVNIESTSPYVGITSATIERKYAEIIVCLAGYISQKIKFGIGKVNTGASGGEDSDIYQANRLAWLMITEFGQDAEFGPISLNVLSEFDNYSEGYLNNQAQIRFQQVMKDLADQTEKILKQNWDKVEALVEVLLQKKIIRSDLFSEIFSVTDVFKIEKSIVAESKPIERLVQFPDSSGILKTPEGYVRYEKDDVIVTDNGHSWPLSREYFIENYHSKESEAGSNIYIKKPSKVRAVQLNSTRRLDLIEGKGLLFGNEGDWLVDYGNQHQSIVSKDDFDRLYTILEISDDQIQFI